MKKKIFLFFVLSLIAYHLSPLHADFFPSNPFTDNARGTIAASFLKLNPSARSASLTDQLISQTNDSMSIFNNPAAFASTANKRQLALASAILPEDIIEAGAVFGAPWRQGKIFFGTHQLIQPEIALYDNLGTKTGSFSPWDALVTGGYALGSPEGIALGFSVSYIQSKVAPSLSGQSLSGSFGVSFLPGLFADKNLGLAFALTNLGLPMSLGSQSYPLPFRLQTELAYALGDKALLGLDLFFPVDQAPYVAGSLEWRLPIFGMTDFSKEAASGLALRAGISSKEKANSTSEKITFGLGIYSPRLALDLAMVSFGVLGAIPKLSLSLGF